MTGCGVLEGNTALCPPPRLAPAAGRRPGHGEPSLRPPCPRCVLTFRHGVSLRVPCLHSAANAGKGGTSCPGSAFPFSPGTLWCRPSPSETEAPVPIGTSGWASRVGSAAEGRMQGNAASVAHRCLLFVLVSGGEVALQVKATRLCAEGAGNSSIPVYVPVWLGWDRIDFPSFVSGRTAPSHGGNMKA